MKGMPADNGFRDLSARFLRELVPMLCRESFTPHAYGAFKAPVSMQAILFWRVFAPHGDVHLKP
jgi:hypothetical protein